MIRINEIIQTQEEITRQFLSSDSQEERKKLIEDFFALAYEFRFELLKQEKGIE